MRRAWAFKQKGIAGVLKALFRMRCTYDPAGVEEEHINRAFAGKFIVTQRSRPDHIALAKRWTAIIQKQGLGFQSVVYANIGKFNADKVEDFGTLHHKVCWVKAYPHHSKGVQCYIGTRLATLPATIICGSFNNVSESRSIA